MSITARVSDHTELFIRSVWYLVCIVYDAGQSYIACRSELKLTDIAIPVIRREPDPIITGHGFQSH